MLRLRLPLCFLLALPLLSCQKSHVPVGASVLGEKGRDGAVAEALADPEVAATGVGIARHVLYGEPAPDTSALQALPGRRAFVCAYQERPRRLCETGVGEDLAGSFEAAAVALKERAGGKIDPDERGDIRLRFDVVTDTRDAKFKEDWDKPKGRSIATWGFFVATEEGEVSWVLPSQVLEDGLWDRKRGFKRKNVRKRLRKQNEDIGELDGSFGYQAFDTVAWIEEALPQTDPPGVFRLYRIPPYERDEATAEVMLQRMVWAADYLLSSVDAKGRIRYRYSTARDRDSSSYNVIRHAGTTYSLLQMYDRTRYEPYLEASVQAMHFLIDNHGRRDNRVGPYLPADHPDQGECLFIVSRPRSGKTEGDVHLGGAGLGLVMLDQYAEATGDTQTFLEEARGMARFIVASQKEDGEFYSFPPRHAGEKPCRDEVSPYYPGESILGLVRLYSYDPNPLWLDTAVRAADWLIDVRDKGKDESEIANDHWLMLGLSYLYLYTEDERYADHSIHICRAVEYQYEKNRKHFKKYPDFQGGYYNPPRSTPAATRGEGLGAVLETCRLAGRECGWIEELLVETVRHEMWCQYTPQSSYWMPNPAKAFGGFNGGLIDADIRNDFVQHNMSSILGLERHVLRQQGTELPGGPGWMEKRLAGTVFGGIPPEELARLRELSVAYRGATIWEKTAEP